MTEILGLERKFHRPETGLVVTDGNGVAGYASVFGRRDSGGDTVVAGAYAASLRRLTEEGRRVKMLWQHDPTRPIGVWEEVVEDDRGLWVRGRLLPEVAKGREAAALIAAGALDGLSIGYRTVKAERERNGGRRLVALELWEVSLVTFPMQSEARVGAKAEAAEDAEGVLRELAQALATARQVLGGQGIAEGFEGGKKG
ncbi:HK97 family phage prohead protease [Rhodobaculum claviforme]|uniref:Peptidase U35 n=1 Tax=Rhodobaculum claviforme TaxID=1549854 RepID=A0A934TN19_9RHOB|nr:HK97 family phage prohead protease [Rhodobaculum claviforme]MBK5928526.1 peptidase U35 [Rhodobaculum claviforme]